MLGVRTRPKYVNQPPEMLYFALDPQDMHHRQYHRQRDCSADRTAYDRDEMRGRYRTHRGAHRQTTGGGVVVAGGEGKGPGAGF